MRNFRTHSGDRVPCGLLRKKGDLAAFRHRFSGNTAMLLDIHTFVIVCRLYVALKALWPSVGGGISWGVMRTGADAHSLHKENKYHTPSTMKKNTNGTSAMLALACAALFASTNANATLAYNDGDLILGFRATGGTGASTDYLVNLGSDSSFLTGSSQLTLNVGNISTDLISIFGAGWKTRSDLFWSVSGVQKFAGNTLPNNSMFATNAETSIGALGTQNSAAWNRASSFSSGAPALKIQSMSNKFAFGTTGAVSGTDQIESTNSAFALIQPTSQSNSFASFMPSLASASSYGYFVGSTPGIEGNFGAGTAGTVLDLYSLTPGAGASSFIGNFSINDSAQVTYTPTGVPEPTSIAILGAGAAMLGMVRRRRTA